MLTAGMILGWGSPVLVKLLNEEACPLEKPLTQNEGSWIMSVTFIGGFFTIFMPVIVNALGRRYTIISSVIPNFISSLFCIFGNSFWTILAGRAIVSIGTTILFNTVPIYAAEIANKEIRGSLGTMMCILFSVGYLIMVAAGPHLSYMACNVLLAISVMVTALPSFLLPESPYCLFIRGKHVDSLEVLITIRDSQASAFEEFSSYSQDKVESVKPNTFTRTFVKSVILLVILALLGNMNGFGFILLYVQTIFISTHLTMSPELATAAVGAISLFAVCFAPFITDRFGRKPILSMSAFGTAIALCGLGTFFYMKDNEYQISGVMNYVPLASLILFMLCYSAGFAPIFFPLVAELFDGPGRSLGVSIVNFCHSLFAFATVKIIPIFLAYLGPANTFWTNAAFSSIQCLFVMLLLPETKGKTFLEIQESLGAKKRDFVTM